jgi:trans-aconitate 2-methyltransferase
LSEQGLAHRIKSAALSRHVLPQAAYYRMLAPLASSLDIWDTRYLQVLEGKDPVLRWIKGTALVPIMAELDEIEASRFLERLKARLAAHYPQESSGLTLFPFARRFIVAVRARAGAHAIRLAEYQ